MSVGVFDCYKTDIEAGLVKMNGVEVSAMRFGLYMTDLRSVT